MLHRLARFRLRSLFIAMSLLAVAAAFVASPIQAYRQEREALSHIPGTREITEPLPLLRVPPELSILKPGSPVAQRFLDSS